jgi:hypothetical protein
LFFWDVAHQATQAGLELECWDYRCEPSCLAITVLLIYLKLGAGAHACNPHNSGEIRRISVRSQPRQLVQETLSWKNPSHKRTGGVAWGVGPEFKPQYHKKKKNQKTLKIRIIPRAGQGGSCL